MHHGRFASFKTSLVIFRYPHVFLFHYCDILRTLIFRIVVFKY